MFKNVRFAEPVVGPHQPTARLPALAAKPKPTESLKRKLEVEDTQIGNTSEAALVDPVTPKKDGLLAGEVKLETPYDERPLKRRLRPKKAKDPEPEVVITQVRPATKRRKAPAKSAPKKKAAPKKTSTKKAATRKKVSEAPEKNAQAQDTKQEDDGANKPSQAPSAPILVPDEEEL